MALTKDRILSTVDRAIVCVNVPEWGGDVFVRPMSGRERDAFESDMVASKDKRLENFRAKLAVASMVDENCAPIFATSDVPALAEKSGAALDRVFEVALKVNRMGKTDVEELTKN